MNPREKLFFKNVELYKSMSYKKREEEKLVKDLQCKFRNELIEKRNKQKLKHKTSIYRKLINWLYGLH